MKNLIIIAFLLINLSIFAQVQGTQEINNLKINGKIIPKSNIINTSPDYVITEDTANKTTTYSRLYEINSTSTEIFIKDSISKYPIDSITISKIILGGSSAIGISSNNGTLATIETMNDSINNAASIGGNNNELLMSDGSGGTKTSSNLTYDGTTFGLDDGANNIFIGDSSGVDITTGQRNNTVGIQTATSLQGGSDNVIMGSFSGDALLGGNDNTIIGSGAGGSLVSGSGNLFLGNEAGGTETGSNKLYMHNSGTSSPLIYGEFDNSKLFVNGSFYITDATRNDTASFYDDGDTTRIESDNPIKIGNNSLVVGNNGNVEMTDTLSARVIKGVMMVERAEVLYTNTTQTTIVTLPKDAVIRNIDLYVKTLFNDSGSDLLSVGTTGTYNNYVLASDISSIFFVKNIEDTNIPDIMTGSTNITFTYVGQNGDATQGEAYVCIHYFIP